MAWVIASIPLWLACFGGAFISVAGVLGGMQDRAAGKISRKELGEYVISGLILLSVSSLPGAIAAWMCS